MKSKDVVVIAVCVLVIGLTGYFGIKMFMPAKPATTAQSEQPTSDKQTAITGEIDQNTLDKIGSLKNYGDTNLNNIGRVNPFAPLN